ncbi:MAG: hypothetical protein J6A89_02345 [Clostridia bacterium]|nr:hypothetical protein [Clostridia bacterium]
MEEKSLKVYETEKTFFSKITNTLNKLLTPSKMGINGVIISMKRNNLLKNYENYIQNEKDSDRKGILLKKYEESYSLYLEAIDKNIIESIYKKVKNNTATEFEKNALSKYYLVIHIKDNDYTEYKYRKQKFLLELDNENVEMSGKTKLINKYSDFYCDKMEALYKNIIKQYSIKLTECSTEKEKTEIYDKIFSTLDEYIINILPKKMEKDSAKEIYTDIKEEYNQYKKYSNNRLDQNEMIEKNMLLLGMSRRLFTHSLPLTVAEQCYIKLIKDLRQLIVDTRVLKKREKAYKQLLTLIDEFNLKVLSTKVYWEKAEQRQEYRTFWKKYQEIEKIQNEEEKLLQKEILFIKSDLAKVRSNENKYCKIIAFYKSKLVELGEMKHLSNKCKTLENGIYIKEMVKKKSKAKAKVKK